MSMSGKISEKKKWPLAVASFFTDAFHAAKGHFCSFLLSNIIGYLTFLQILFGQSLFCSTTFLCTIRQKLCFDTLICEKPLCRKVSEGKALSVRLRFFLLSHFLIRSSFFKWLTFFVSSDFFKTYDLLNQIFPKLTIFWNRALAVLILRILGRLKQFLLITSEIQIYFAACDLFGGAFQVFTCALVSPFLAI